MKRCIRILIQSTITFKSTSTKKLCRAGIRTQAIDTCLANTHKNDLHDFSSKKFVNVLPFPTFPPFSAIFTEKYVKIFPLIRQSNALLTNSFFSAKIPTGGVFFSFVLVAIKTKTRFETVVVVVVVIVAFSKWG